MAKSIILDRAHLDAFKAKWPCHGLPESLHSIRFDFADNGDLVDLEAKARNGRVLDTAKFDGPPLVALCQDAQAMEPETPVLFRIERRRGGEVCAVFPCEPPDMSGRTMTCYAHVGQHGGCSFEWYQSTGHRRAKPEEYADLKRELESAPYGYRLKVYERIQPWMRDAFRAEIRRLNSRGNR